MDVARKRLLQAIEHFEESVGGHVPHQLKRQLESTKEMVTAPIYSQESPGEQASREVAEASMPADVAEKYFDQDEADENVEAGVLQDI